MIAIHKDARASCNSSISVFTSCLWVADLWVADLQSKLNPLIYQMYTANRLNLLKHLFLCMHTRKSRDHATLIKLVGAVAWSHLSRILYMGLGTKNVQFTFRVSKFCTQGSQNLGTVGHVWAPYYMCKNFTLICTLNFLICTFYLCIGYGCETQSWIDATLEVATHPLEIQQRAT